MVREAVHQLKSRGLLVSRQGSGVYVAAPGRRTSRWPSTPACSNRWGAVVHVVEVRRVLEGEIAALAAQRATRTQVAGLKRALAEIDRAEAEGRDGVAEDLAFHRAIGEATGNLQFSRLLGFSSSTCAKACASRAATRRGAGISCSRCATSTAPSSTRSPHDAAARAAAPPSTSCIGERRLEQGGVITRGKRAKTAVRS